MNENLRCTRFDNGITVYVNFGDKDEQTPLGTVGAMDFLIGGDGNAKK